MADPPIIIENYFGVNKPKPIKIEEPDPFQLMGLTKLRKKAETQEQLNRTSDTLTIEVEIHNANEI